MRKLHHRIAAGAGLALFGLTAAAVFGGCRRHGGGHDPAAVRAHIRDHIDDVLDEIDATDAQRGAIDKIGARVFADLSSLHDGPSAQGAGELHDALIAEWRSDAPDADRVKALIDAKLEQIREVAHKTTDNVLAVHAVLEPEQRRQVADLVERLRPR